MKRFGISKAKSNANQQSWGDYIEIGFSPNATNGYDAGKDELHFPISVAGVVEYTNLC